MTRKVVILGATGSVGRQALDVIRAHPDHLQLIGAAAGHDADALETIATQWPGVATGLGSDAAVEMAGSSDADIVLNAIVGAAGLRASLATLESGKTLALANKESLIAGGELCRAACARSGSVVMPIDSEHAALAQCLEGRNPASVLRLILTASGGPFRTRTDLSGVTVKEALAHPTWSMGPKITIDCATLMNKGLEVIEAHYLFGYSSEKIDVVVHPQSVVHAMVEIVDGSFVMQAAPTDMRIPIQAALTAPDRAPSPADRMDPRTLEALTFETLDEARFPAVGLAYGALRIGGTAPAVLNAANEVAVAAFLDERLSFDKIARVVEVALQAHEPREADTLESVLDADDEGRHSANLAIERIAETIGSKP